MTDFTDHVGAALATRDEDDREDWEPPARADDRPTPSGPYSCLHRGHGLCGDCPDDEQRTTAEAAHDGDCMCDGCFAERCDTIGRMLGKREPLDDAHIAGCMCQDCDPLAGCRGDRALLAKAMLHELPDECDCGDVPNVRHLDPDGHLPGCPESSTYALHLLQNLLAVVHGDGGHCQDRHGLAKAARDGEAAVIADRVARDEALDALSALLCAFPQLAAGYSTSEQQAALRQARAVCDRHGRPTRNPVSREIELQRQP